MSEPSLKSIVETILFASDKPLNAGELLKVINRARSEMAAEGSASADKKSP